MKNWFHKHYIKHREKLTKANSQWLKSYLDQPVLWSTEAEPLARAMAVGVFVGMLPLPGHMLMAGFLAVFFRANLLLSILMVWVSNPITLAPITYFEYKLGTILLKSPVYQFSFEPTREWFTHHFIHLWRPLFLGTLLLASGAAALSYLLLKLFARNRAFVLFRKKVHRLKQHVKRAIK